MVYYARNMELEVISQVFHGSVNDVAVCRDRLSASGALYTLLVVHDRECARKLLMVMEDGQRSGESACLLQFSQNETMLFLFPYREERKFSAFAAGQMTSPEAGEAICINLVMECLSTSLPWPLLYLVLEQDCVQIAKDNTVYFTTILDLKDLEPARTERNCVSSCARLLLDLLVGPVAGGRHRSRKLKSFELIRKKTGKNAYTGFPELYQDIKVTALPQVKPSLKSRFHVFWNNNRDRLFRILLALCVLLAVAAVVVLISQLIFGDVPLLRLFRHTFDVIGTENLHQGGRS